MGECRHFSCDSDVVLPWRHRNYAAIQDKLDGRAMAPGGGRRLCWLRGGGVPPLRSRAVPIPRDSDAVLEWWHQNYAAIQGNMGEQ